MFVLPAEAVAVDHLFLSSAKNISGPVCLRTTGYRLTIVLWCALGLPEGGTIQIPQLQLQFCCDNKRFTHTDTRLTALFPGLHGWAGTRKVKPIRILLKQETASGSGISLAICKSAPRSRQITMPVPYHSKFFTGRMPFLPPNQQRQSTEGNYTATIQRKYTQIDATVVSTLWAQ